MPPTSETRHASALETATDILIAASKAAVRRVHPRNSQHERGTLVCERVDYSELSLRCIFSVGRPSCTRLNYIQCPTAAQSDAWDRTRYVASHPIPFPIRFGYPNRGHAYHSLSVASTLVNDVERIAYERADRRRPRR